MSRSGEQERTKVKTVAVIPVKSLALAKTRLASILTPNERALLMLDMLSHILSAVGEAGEISRVAVISPDPAELHLPDGVVPLVQAGTGLNAVLEQGREWASGEGAEALLVIFADLPLVSASDISRMAALGSVPGTVVLAADRHGTGTNAMLAHPPSVAPFAFGPGSLAAHVAAAHAGGVRVELYRSPGTALDIDTLDDLAFLEAHRTVTAMEYAFS